MPFLCEIILFRSITTFFFISLFPWFCPVDSVVRFVQFQILWCLNEHQLINTIYVRLNWRTVIRTYSSIHMAAQLRLTHRVQVALVLPFVRIAQTVLTTNIRKWPKAKNSFLFWNVCCVLQLFERTRNSGALPLNWKRMFNTRSGYAGRFHRARSIKVARNSEWL